MLDERYPNVTAYNDRHGKRRYRYRKARKTVSLPGNPGENLFDLAYERAVSGNRRRPSRRNGYISEKGLEERRLSFLDHFLAPALKRARTRAMRQHVAFSLTADDLAPLIEAQDWKCAVSGMDFILRNPGTDRTQHAFRPTIDRIVPKDGYVIGNVRIVCEIVNLAMNNWGEGPLLKMAKALVANERPNHAG